MAVSEFVGSVGTTTGLGGEGDGDADGERFAGFDGGDEEVSQRAARDVFHREEGGAVVFAEFVDLHHVGVVNPGDVTRLGNKHVDEALVNRQMREDAFDDDEALEARQLPLKANEDLRHTARRQAIDHLIAADAGGNRQQTVGVGRIAPRAGNHSSSVPVVRARRQSSTTFVGFVLHHVVVVPARRLQGAARKGLQAPGDVPPPSSDDRRHAMTIIISAVTVPTTTAAAAGRAKKAMDSLAASVLPRPGAAIPAKNQNQP